VILQVRRLSPARRRCQAPSGLQQTSRVRWTKRASSVINSEGENGRATLQAYSTSDPTGDKRRHSAMLCDPVRFTTAVLFAVVVIFAPVGAAAQSGDQKGDQQRPPAQAGDAAKDGPPKKIDEFVEAARILGGPAANPECVWLGRRVVNLLWRDDLDTAFRHLDLYDRFGCPGGHVQATFRCVVRQGNIDPKAPESLSARVHACWINPSLQPQTAAAPQSANPDKPDAANK